MIVDKESYWYIFWVHIAVGVLCGYFAIIEDGWLLLFTALIFIAMSIFLKFCIIIKKKDVSTRKSAP